MREAGLSCLSVCHQNLGLITTTKGLNTSKRHSNNDNSEKIVHGVPEASRVAEAVLFARISSYLWRSLVPRLHKSDWGRDYRGRGYTELGYKFSHDVIECWSRPLHWDRTQTMK